MPICPLQVERYCRMMDLCASAEDYRGSERLFQRLVRLGSKSIPAYLIYVYCCKRSLHPWDPHTI